jgi:lipopolysaccharide-binding protein
MTVLGSLLLATAALKVAVSPSALQYIASLIPPILLQKLKSAPLPDLNSVVGTPIGDIDLQVSGCYWDNVQLGPLSVQPHASAADNELEVDVDVTLLVLTCNWHYRKVHWPHISDGGSADIGFGQTSIASVVNLLDSNGHAGVTAQTCDLTIGQFGLQLHGGASWLYNLFIGAFQGKIENAIGNAIVNAICSGIDQQLNIAVQSLPTELPFGPELGVDYALMATPLVDPVAGIVLPCLGEFYDQANPAMLDPCAGQPIPNTVVNNRMIQFVVGSCALDSIGFALQNAGLLSVAVSNADLPPGVAFSLNTDYFEFIIPQLYAKYPHTNMSAVIATPQQPHLSLQGNVIVIKSLVYINVSVDAPQPIPAFTVATALSVNASIALNGTTLIPTLGWIAGSSSLVSSNFGNYWTPVVLPLLTDTLRYVALPVANEALAAGFAIPSNSHMTLKNPTVQITNNLLVVASDFTLAL